MKKRVIPGLCLSVALIAGCAGNLQSKQSYNQSLAVNSPNKTEGCYDASILVSKNMHDSNKIAKRVLAAIDTTIKSETNTNIQAQRNRHIGLLVGSGGEQISVTLKQINNNRTFVTVATKTGFVGGAGQKPWSCKIVDEMAKMARK